MKEIIGIGCLAIIIYAIVNVLIIPLTIVFLMDQFFGYQASYWVVVLAWWVLSVLFSKAKGTK